MKRVLVVGKDARTHAIGQRLRDDGADVYAVSDFEHPGLKRVAVEFKKCKTDDPVEVIEFAKRIKPDLVFVGPEEPLEAGLVDEIDAALRTPCVGPTRALARLESSKSFTRNLLKKYGIPGSIEYRVFPCSSHLGEIREYLSRLREFAVKPDGLTGGKGVRVSGDHLASVEDAVEYVRLLFRDSPNPVVIEEKLDGEEFSLQSLYDGKNILHTFPVQDHKRAGVGDSGPNTGGMGSYSCEDHSLPFLTVEQVTAAQQINAAVAKAVSQEVGQDYRGVLFGGFMATGDGVRVLEYNARFGDPEALNVLPLMRGNFVDVSSAVAEGRLDCVPVDFERRATVCKYLVPRGYPVNAVRDVPVSVPVTDSSDCRVYFAAVDDAGGDAVILKGSRAVAFVGIAGSVPEAAAIAEDAICKIQGPVEHRSDIGTPALLQKRVDHLRQVSAKRRAYSLSAPDSSNYFRAAIT